MSEPVVRVEHVSKKFRRGQDADYARLSELLLSPFSRGRNRSQGTVGQEFWALQDIAFEVQPGEVLGIIGRNGAGKSTLLKILSRITRPTTGWIGTRGRVGSLLEVGTGFHPELTGRENIYLNGSILGMSRREIAGFTEIEEFIDTPVKRYSSGMYTRLAFSVAAHLEPEILIIDEVLAVGDAAFQKKCLGKMREVAHAGRTVLFVSHNMAAVNGICSQCLLLESGRLLQSGNPRDVSRAYLRELGEQRTGEVTWAESDPSVRNETVRLQAVRISQGAEEVTTGLVDIGLPVAIEIDFVPLKPLQKLYVALWLRDINGTPVLGSMSAPGLSRTPLEWFGEALPTSTIRARCVIPGGLLNTGTYVVCAFVNRFPHEIVLAREDALAFDTFSRESLDSFATTNWYGVVRPQLDWSLSPVNAR